LTSSWTEIFRTGNDTDKEKLSLFRQYHCAECLKAYHKNQTKSNCEQQQQQQQQQSVEMQRDAELATLRAQMQMNTPPPPLQPINDDTMNGLIHYFGDFDASASQALQSHQLPPPPPQSQPPPSSQLSSSSSSFSTSTGTGTGTFNLIGLFSPADKIRLNNSTLVANSCSSTPEYEFAASSVESVGCVSGAGSFDFESSGYDNERFFFLD
jgi:hypothetical protein